MKRECRKLKFKEQNKEKNSKKKQNDTVVVTDGELMIIRDDASINLIGQETDWVIDYGASFRVTSRADFFTSYSQGEFGNVSMGNEDVSKLSAWVTFSWKQILDANCCLEMCGMYRIFGSI